MGTTTITLLQQSILSRVARCIPHTVRNVNLSNEGLSHLILEQLSANDKLPSPQIAAHMEAANAPTTNAHVNREPRSARPTTATPTKTATFTAS